MTPPSGDGDKLAALLSSLLPKVTPSPAAPACDHESLEPLVALTIYSFLLWESTPHAAQRAFGELCGRIIDTNELRVALPEEIVEWTGVKDPFATERADRLRASLNALFRREHRVSLAHLESRSKREVREYLDGLEGMPSFVAARVTLFGFHGHAVPIDRRLCDMLIREDVLDPALPLDEAERWLERQIRASDTEQIVPVLEAWRDAAPRGGARKSSSKRPPRKAASKRTKKDA